MANALENEHDDIQSETIALCINSVDSFVSSATTVVSLSNVDVLDEALVSVCTTSTSTNGVNIPESNHNKKSFDLTCSTSSEEESIVVETSTITIALSSEVNDDDPVSVVVTTWNDEFITNSDNATSNLLSDIQGVTVKTDNGDKLEETEDIDNTFE